MPEYSKRTVRPPISPSSSSQRREQSLPLSFRAEDMTAPFFSFFARARQRLPSVAVELPQQQQFRLGSSILLDAHEAGRQDARVVDDDVSPALDNF